MCAAEKGPRADHAYRAQTINSLSRTTSSSTTPTRSQTSARPISRPATSTNVCSPKSSAQTRTSTTTVARPTAASDRKRPTRHMATFINVRAPYMFILFRRNGPTDAGVWPQGTCGTVHRSLGTTGTSSPDALSPSSECALSFLAHNSVLFHMFPNFYPHTCGLRCSHVHLDPLYVTQGGLPQYSHC